MNATATVEETAPEVVATPLSSAPELRRKPAMMLPKPKPPEAAAPPVKRSHRKKAEKPAAPAASPTPPAKPAAKAKPAKAEKPAEKPKEQKRVTYLGGSVFESTKPWLKKGARFIVLGETESHGKTYLKLSTLDGKKVFHLKPALCEVDK